jgi:uncharacterized protein
MENFPCTSCGLCCKIVGHVLADVDKVTDPVIKQLFNEFPYETTDGVCSMLQPDNTCAVYDTRPDMCNIKTMSKIRGITDLNEYYKINAQICNSWVQLNKLDSSYLINLEQFNHAK